MTNYLDKIQLDKKTVFVCGGAGLIGAEVCRALAQAKAKVVILDVNATAGKKLERDIRGENGQATFEHFDIADLDGMQAALTKLIEKHKVPSVWVNASYPRTLGWGQSDLENLKLATLRQNVDMQLNSTIWSSRLISLIMMKNKMAGSIIHFGSIYGVQANDFTIYEGTDMKSPLPYSAIKGGVISVTRYLAAYLGPHGIRANTICPGGILDGQDKKFVKNYERKVPLQRMGKAEDMASAVLFLASEASSYMTGNTILVDGGWTVV